MAGLSPDLFTLEADRTAYDTAITFWMNHFSKEPPRLPRQQAHSMLVDLLATDHDRNTARIIGIAALRDVEEIINL